MNTQDLQAMVAVILVLIAKSQDSLAASKAQTNMMQKMAELIGDQSTIIAELALKVQELEAKC